MSATESRPSRSIVRPISTRSTSTCSASSLPPRPTSTAVGKFAWSSCAAPERRSVPAATLRASRRPAIEIHDFINSLGPSIQAFVQWMRQTPAIVVAVVQGAVAGGGVGLMLAADVVIAAEDATVAVAYARLGTSPDAGASYFLARALGYRKALELYLMSERLDGRQAKALGLVNFTAPPALLDAEAEALIRRLASRACDRVRVRQTPVSPGSRHRVAPASRRRDPTLLRQHASPGFRRRRPRVPGKAPAEVRRQCLSREAGEPI